MTSAEHAVDPCPTIPKAFVDPAPMHDLSREIKRFSGDREAAEGPPDEAPDDRDGKPRVLVKSVVATRAGVDAFGQRLVAEAHARGFHAARRKAFVADGSSTNWGVHRTHFSHYTPILDFTHAICYVYAAAMAGRRGEAAWRDYGQSAQWLWSGNTTDLIAAIAARSNALGLPAKDDETSRRPSSPRRWAISRTNVRGGSTIKIASWDCRSPAATSNRPSNRSIAA